MCAEGGEGGADGAHVMDEHLSRHGAEGHQLSHAQEGDAGERCCAAVGHDRPGEQNNVLILTKNRNENFESCYQMTD